MDILALLKAELDAKPTFEWTGKLGGETVTFYAKPITPADMAVVNREYPGFEQSPSLPGFVTLLVHKAITADGKRVFMKGRDTPMLLALPAMKINEIVKGLFGDMFEFTTIDDETLKEDEGN